MKIELNIMKKHLYLLMTLIVALTGLSFVIAFNAGASGGEPAKFGHSLDEIDWSKPIATSVIIQGNEIDNGGIRVVDLNATGNISVVQGVEIQGDLMVKGYSPMQGKCYRLDWGIQQQNTWQYFKATIPVRCAGPLGPHPDAGCYWHMFARQHDNTNYPGYYNRDRAGWITTNFQPSGAEGLWHLQNYDTHGGSSHYRLGAAVDAIMWTHHDLETCKVFDNYYENSKWNPMTYSPTAGFQNVGLRARAYTECTLVICERSLDGVNMIKPDFTQNE